MEEQILLTPAIDYCGDQSMILKIARSRTVRLLALFMPKKV